MKFVKLKCNNQGVYNNWFLEYNGEDIDYLLNFNLRTFRCVKKVHDPNDVSPLKKMVMSSALSLDFKKVYDKYKKTLYVRETGSYMFSNGLEIVDSVESDYFPIPEEKIDILIIENDTKPEWFWNMYIKKRFPNKKITVLPFFDLRDDNEVKAWFKRSEIITFSTTFTTEKGYDIVKRCHNNQKIIAFSHDENYWNYVDIIPNLEIVKRSDKLLTECWFNKDIIY